jgi:hypothetical protein
MYLFLYALSAPRRRHDTSAGWAGRRRRPAMRPSRFRGQPGDPGRPLERREAQRLRSRPRKPVARDARASRTGLANPSVEHSSLRILRKLVCVAREPEIRTLRKGASQTPGASRRSIPSGTVTGIRANPAPAKQQGGAALAIRAHEKSANVLSTTRPAHSRSERRAAGH